MIEQITAAYTDDQQGARLDQVIAQLVDIPPNPTSEVNRYVEAEEQLHQHFETFIAGRERIALRRYQAAASDRQWQVDVHAPVQLTPEETAMPLPLQAFPFREFDIVNHEWRTIPLKHGAAYHTVPTSEHLEPRAIGFYFTKLTIANVLRSQRVAEPWAWGLQTPRLGVAQRLAPRIIRSAGLVVTPNLSESQHRFAELLTDIEQLSAQDTEAQASLVIQRF